MLRQTLIRLSQERHLQNFAVHNGLARGMARRFVAGETLQEAIDVVRDLNRRNLSATLDHLGENVSSVQEAREAADAYRSIFQAVARAGLACNASLKLTHMGLDLGESHAFDNVRRVVEEAGRLDNFVRIDMESSDYVDRTLEIFTRLFQEYKNVGTVIQSYLYRSASDLEHLIHMGARVRLVKGAYLEPPHIAFQDKTEVDASFIRLTESLLLHGNYPAIATHDASIIQATLQFARMNRIDPSHYEFQMLYGIRRDLQAQLVGDGNRMRIYVPFGTAWYPYLMRRMAERPANLMFVLGNIAREVTSHKQ